VVDGNHPAVFESVPYLRSLADRRDPAQDFFLVYLPGREKEGVVNGWIQYAYDLVPVMPESPRAMRPLGGMKVFPMTFIIDRHGRIRQRWAGFSQTLTEEALKAALAES